MTMYCANASEFYLPDICVLEDEYEQLADVVCAAPRATPGITLLWQELQRADIVSRARPDRVHLGSLVAFTELRGDVRRAARIVPPGGQPDGRRLSVASAVGAALIGLRAGDTFRWLSNAGHRRSVRVESVLPDPRGAERLRAERMAALRREVDEILCAR